MAQLWKGAPVAAALSERVSAQVEALKDAGVFPTLAIVRVGERPEDLSYERGAMKRCDKVGVAVRQFLLPEDAGQEELLAVIEQINSDNAIHGCLMFRPLPKYMDEEAVCRALSPAKDVDGITDGSMAGVFAGNGHGFPPCTAQACLELLDYYGCALQGKRVVVVGRSLVIGKPAAMLLLGRHATVTICHTRTADLSSACRQAEVLVVAAGKAGVVGAEHVSPGQVIIDVGINVDGDGNLLGDADFSAVEPVVGAITPVPGGVGAVTTSVLAGHVAQAAARANGISLP